MNSNITFFILYYFFFFLNFYRLLEPELRPLDDDLDIEPELLLEDEELLYERVDFLGVELDELLRVFVFTFGLGLLLGLGVDVVPFGLGFV